MEKLTSIREEKLRTFYARHTDLRESTRASDRCEARVLLSIDWDITFEWLLLGQCQLGPRGRQRDGRYALRAYYREGVTDEEHDSAVALRLPLVGLEFAGVDYHQARFVAWVDSSVEADDDSGDFRVPVPGYDQLAGARKCKSKPCEPHLITEHYLPPFDAALYRAVRGRKVEILVGPAA